MSEEIKLVAFSIIDDVIRDIVKEESTEKQLYNIQKKETRFVHLAYNKF